MKRIISIIFVMLMLLSSVACGKSAEPTWQEQYDLGVRYLSDGNYEEAIIAFTAAIEIDPKREEAYVGLADVYYATGDTAKAEEILAQRPERGSEDSVVSRTERVDNEDGSYQVVEYDASGIAVRITWYNDDGTIVRVIDHDASGNVSRETEYNANGMVIGINEYDALGYCVRETSYNADGMVDHYYVYEYDASRHVSRVTSYNADGTVDDYSIFEYYASGNEEHVKMYTYNADGTVKHG